MSINLYSHLEKKVTEKIATAISEFVVKDRLTFYGYFLQNVNFYRTDKIRTAGVNFRNLTMNFYYNEKFIEKLSIKQVKFLCIHELYHLLFNHPKRGNGYIHRIANFAMDMIINEIIESKFSNDILTSDGTNRILKHAITEWIPGVVKMDSNYKGERIFELVYIWTQEKYNLWKEKYEEEEKKKIINYLINDIPEIAEVDENDSVNFNLSDKITEKRRKENEELGIDEYTRKFFENDFPQFDTHFWDDIPEEIRSQIVERNIGNLKGRGIDTSDSQEILGKLRKKKNDDVIKLLKKSISSMKGFSKMNSFKKPSKKGLEGLKGRIKYSNTINCILDTSGSMMGSFEIVLSEVFKDDYIINMIQCDSEVKGFVPIKNKNQLQKMTVKGLGGTILQPGIDYVFNNRELKGNNLIILTDGATDMLDFSKFSGVKVLILTVHTPCPLKEKYNNVNQIVVENKKSFKK